MLWVVPAMFASNLHILDRNLLRPELIRGSLVTCDCSYVVGMAIHVSATVSIASSDAPRRIPGLRPLRASRLVQLWLYNPRDGKCQQQQNGGADNDGRTGLPVKME